jgi:hypothetical protein
LSFPLKIIDSVAWRSSKLPDMTVLQKY